MAVMIRDVLAQPAPERLDGHQIRTVPRQRHQFDVQRAGDLPDGLGPVIGRAVPQHDQLAIGPFGPQPSKNLDGVLAVGAREGPQPHLTFVVEIKPIEGEIKPIEGDAGGQTRRVLSGLAPASINLCSRTDDDVLKPMSARARRLEPLLRTSPYAVLSLAGRRGRACPAIGWAVSKDPATRGLAIRNCYGSEPRRVSIALPRGSVRVHILKTSE